MTKDTVLEGKDERIRVFENCIGYYKERKVKRNMVLKERKQATEKKEK